MNTVRAWWWLMVGAMAAKGAAGATLDIDVLLNWANDANHRYRISGELIVERAPKETNLQPQASQSAFSHGVMVVAGGRAGGEWVATRDVELLHLEQGQSRIVAPLPSPRSHVGMTVLNGNVYIVGGFENKDHPCLGDVDVYDFVKNAWIAGPPLLQCRLMPGVGVLNSTIYAVGGYNHQWLRTVEALDVGAATWRSIASMNEHRNGAIVVLLDGKLYAVGGNSASNDIQTVERYDPRADVWKSVPEMSIQRRFECGFGVLERALYAVGGQRDSVTVRTVERYRPEGKWTEMPPMYFARHSPAVVSYQGKLYVVGGNDNRVIHNTIEVFDPTTETWTVLNTTLSIAKDYPGVAVLE